MLKQWLRHGGVLVAFTLQPALRCQEKPLNVNVSVSTGYYSSTTRGEVNHSLSFVPLGARFEMGGYYLSPDLLSFSAQPELNLGPQASNPANCLRDFREGF